MSHLGGYIPGGDPATLYPDLWRWLVEKKEVSSMIDIGCGEGYALSYFRDLGCRVLGIDGIGQEDPDIVAHDYTLGEVDLHGSVFDLAWSCEFVEHIEEMFVRNFLSSFKTASIALITHADPGQPGHHHVNCRSSEYWAGVMAASGFLFDQELTSITRSIAGLNLDPLNHYYRSGMAFINHARPLGG